MPATGASNACMRWSTCWCASSEIASPKEISSELSLAGRIFTAQAILPSPRAHSSVGALHQMREVVGAEGKRGPDRGSREDVAEEVHAEQDARRGHAHGAKQKTDCQSWIELAERHGYRERGNGVARREGELVGRQQGGPAMRLDGARTFAAGHLLETKEECDPDGRGQGSRGYGQKARLAAEQQNDEPHSYHHQPAPAPGADQHPKRAPGG